MASLGFSVREVIDPIGIGVPYKAMANVDADATADVDAIADSDANAITIAVEM
jgi:hypothetical protein